MLDRWEDVKQRGMANAGEKTLVGVWAPAPAVKLFKQETDYQKGELVKAEKSMRML